MQLTIASDNAIASEAKQLIERVQFRDFAPLVKLSIFHAIENGYSSEPMCFIKRCKTASGVRLGRGSFSKVPGRIFR